MFHTGPISGIATHAEKLIATAGYDNRVILWDAVTRRPLGRVFHDHLANQCAFSPDGKLLATASSDYSGRLWSLPDLRLQAVLTGHDDDVEMVAFAPDGERVATCSRDHTIGIFDVRGNRLHNLVGHGADVISVTWSSDGSELISSSDDGTIRRWDTESGAQTAMIDMGGVETDTVVITAGGCIYSGDDEGRISVVSNDVVTSVQAHNAGIKRLIYSSQFELLASLSYDKTLRIWSINEDHTISELQTATFPPIVWPRSGAFLNRNVMVFGTFGSTYASYDLITRTWSIADIVADESINALAYCPDGRQARIGDAGICVFSDGVKVTVPSLCNFLLPIGNLVLAGGQTGDIFDVVAGTLVHTHHSPINCAVKFRRDGVDHAIIGTYTGEGIVLRLAKDGKSLAHVQNIQLHSNAVKGLAADEKHIFSVSADGGAAWHQTSNLSVTRTVSKAHAMIANGCARLKEGTFVSVSRDRCLRIWRDDSVQVVEAPHVNSIKCVACSDNGRYIATGSYFGKIAVYDTQADTWVLELRPSSSGISNITAIPGEQVFSCSSYDGAVHTFSASTL